MAGDPPVGADGTARPRVIVSVTATADGRVTLSRTERLLDDGPSRRWQAAWSPDYRDLLARRADRRARHAIDHGWATARAWLAPRV